MNNFDFWKEKTMRKFIICIVLFFICSCASKQTAKKDGPPSPPPLAEIPTQTLGESPLSSQEAISPLYGKLLSKIETSTSSFNPSQGVKVTIDYHLEQPAKITLNVYDPDWDLIRTITHEKDFESGENTIIWDGKGGDGKVVPDEAYFFTIIAEDNSGNKEIYDPTTFSGGEEHDITKVDINSQSQTITYKLPEMGRVMIRIGVQGGPLLNTVVDWKPRVKGAVTEYWNGKDKDNHIDLYNNPNTKMIVTYFTLPENSVITFGNKEQTFKNYKKSLAEKRTQKPERASTVKKLSHHYRIPRAKDYSPGVRMTFGNTEDTNTNGIPVLKDKTIVKVELNEQDKTFFANQQYEVVFFVDNEFYAEDESGYTPFNWVWNLSDVKEGEHLLTVNLSSFKDQIGVLSRKVKVIK